MSYLDALAIFLMFAVTSVLILAFISPQKKEAKGLPYRTKPLSTRFAIWLLLAVPMLMLIEYLPDGAAKYFMVFIAYVGFPAWAVWGQPKADKAWDARNEIEKQKNATLDAENAKLAERTALIQSLEPVSTARASAHGLSQPAQQLAAELDQLLKK